MTSRPASRFAALTPSLFFAAFLTLAGCATQSTGPIAPISSGDPRVDPVPGQSPHDTAVVGDQTIEELTEDVDSDYTPPHMQDRDVIRAGVMLPFSDRRAGVRNQAEGMLAGIELALFDHAGEDFVLLPKDTRGSKTTAETMASDLNAQGADFVLGPLFGTNVTAARNILAVDDVPVISFSTDVSVAGAGAWLASIAPEAEVAEIIAYASLRGYDQFAFFGADSSLGLRVERAMQYEVSKNGGLMIASSFYPSDTISPDVEAASFAASVERAAARGARVAVLVPERGNRLRRIAPLLAYHGVDTRLVKMLGTGAWNDPEVWREPSLNGAWFPSPPQSEMSEFKQRYQRQYGREPSSLAAVAYDATALAIMLAEDGEITTEELTNRDGFAGLNGLFRFRFDGTAERSLEIMEIDPSEETGLKRLRGVASSFDPSSS